MERRYSVFGILYRIRDILEAEHLIILWNFILQLNRENVTFTHIQQLYIYNQHDKQHFTIP